jgi:diguanylate cyclase (GGDEF)-like protein
VNTPSPDVLDEILRSERLPSPSGVALRILELTRDEDASVEDLQQVLASDPALAGRILQYANCAEVCGGREVRSVADAVVRLGMNTVRQLSLTFSVRAGARGGPCTGFDYNLFWSRSLAVAVGAQSLAPLVRGVVAEEAFTCGLLGQVGQLALASTHPRVYASILERWNGHDRTALSALEQTDLMIDHEQVTGALLTSWGLPEQYATAVTQARVLRRAGEDEVRGLSRVLAAATAIADICVANDEARSPLIKALTARAEELELVWTDVAAATDRALAEWARMGRVLDILTEDLPTLEELTARAERYRAIRPVTAEGSSAMREIAEPDLDAACNDQPLRILVVDDSPMDLKIVTTKLAKEGHELQTAADGEEGLALALRWNPHLIISDWMMPRMDGLELCRALRRAENIGHVYVMMMTSNDQSEDLVTALDAGADDYIPKPINHGVLLARLRAATRVIRLQERAVRDREAIREFAAELSVANRKLQHLALYDTLTGLPNRRYAMDRLNKEWSRSRRHGTSLIVMILDIDHFKRVNDTYGHDAGDVVLRETALTMKQQLRASDDICRFGGEEFLVICPDANVDLARMIADRLRVAVQDHRIATDEFEGGVTVSVGVSTTGEDVESLAELLKLADEGLYAAKHAGRNKICIVDHTHAAS